MTKRVTIISAHKIQPVTSPQGQKVYPLITEETSGSEFISQGLIIMQPGGVSKAHVHEHSEIIVTCLEGTAATLIFDDKKWISMIHGKYESIFIPDGVPHVAVNLSNTTSLAALESRSDPKFEDVTLLPEYEEEIFVIARAVRQQYLIELEKLGIRT